MKQEGDIMIGSRILCQFDRAALGVLAILLIMAPGLAAGNAQDAWAALVKGGHVVLIRHGNAPPGYGDPPDFRIDDCTTQRNLDDIGREQARALGRAFRKHDVRVDRILSSPMCRCLETARLMAVGPVESSWTLFPNRDPTSARFLQLKEMVSTWRGPGTLVLVTHGFTIQTLLEFLMPMQGEMVVLKPAPDSELGANFVGRLNVAPE